MAVTEEQTNISYVSAGEKNFVIPFTYLEKDNVKVFISEKNSSEKIELKNGVDFAVENGYVIFNEIVAKRTIVFIERQTEISNNNEFQNNSKLPAGTLNYGFDKLTMICQELAEKLSHTLIYEGEEQLDYAELMQKLIDIQKYVQNSEQLSAAIVNSAVSAAQALASALQSRQFRDEAEKFAQEAAADSDIATHNNYEEAHPYIRELISALDLIIEQHLQQYAEHIEDYEQHITDNSSAHQNFDDEIVAIDRRVEILENVSALKKGNMYFAFGYNNKCQLGVNWTTNITAEPVEHFALRNVKKVSTSLLCGVAIAGGRIYVTGNGTNGLCGPDRSACYGFKPLAPFDNIYNFVDTACFDETALALTDDGKLFSWGNGNLHCLGDGTTLDRAVPRQILPDVKIKKIVAGCRVILALTEDGSIYSCGSSAYGALGHSVASETSALLKEITSLNNIINIAAGGYVNDGKYLNFCAAIQQNEGEPKHLFMWGYNGSGQLGTGNTTNISAPILVELDFVPQKVVCGAGHTVVLSSEGNVYIAGKKEALQSSANKTTFTMIEFDDLIVDIAAGRDITYLLTNNNNLYALGAANYGSMLSQKSSATPVRLFNDKVELIFAGCQNYGCAFTKGEIE